MDKLASWAVEMEKLSDEEFVKKIRPEASMDSRQQGVYSKYCVKAGTWPPLYLSDSRFWSDGEAQAWKEARKYVRRRWYWRMDDHWIGNSGGGYGFNRMQPNNAHIVRREYIERIDVEVGPGMGGFGLLTTIISIILLLGLKSRLG